MAGRVADIFDELTEDLRAERSRAMAMRYGLLGAVLLALVLGGFGGWKGWEWWQARQAQAYAVPYLDAMRTADALPADAGPARLAAADAFAKVAATAPAGYRTLARLREAGLRWDAGDTDAAYALWDRIGTDADADPLLRDLASLLWAQHAVDKAQPEAVVAHIRKLEGAGNVWGPLAREVDAELSLRLDEKEAARGLYRGLLVDPLATDGLRTRAGEMLVLLGGNPGARG